MFLPKTLWRTRVSTLEFKNCIFLQRSRKKKSAASKTGATTKTPITKKATEAATKTETEAATKQPQLQ